MCDVPQELAVLPSREIVLGVSFGEQPSARGVNLTDRALASTARSVRTDPG